MEKINKLIEEFKVIEDFEIADKKAIEIIEAILTEIDTLPTDFIIETLTRLYWAPSVICDDEPTFDSNGDILTQSSFAISCDGISNVRSNPTDNFQFSTLIAPEFFQPNIRLALKYFLEYSLKENTDEEIETGVLDQPE